MKKYSLSLLTLVALLTCLTAYSVSSNPSHCKSEQAPKVIKPMADWDIIATNVANIDVTSVFSGDKLSYSVSAHPSSRKNIVTINKAKGMIRVQAEKKDDFDVTVTAKNSCGKAYDKFNVIIDEEE